MLKKVWRSTLLALVLIPTLVNLSIGRTYADASLSEDDLNSMSWGAPKLPYNQAANIKDSLVDAPVGKVVVDRHGIGPTVLFQGPFSQPYPGRAVFVSLWGSKIEGCFLETIVQLAPPNGEANLEALVPTLLELGVGGQIVQLSPQPSAKPKGGTQNYTYTVTDNNGKESTVSSTWYMTRTIFGIDSKVANILRDAPAKEVRARITFGNNQSTIIPIGVGTVSNWKEAYSFNPKCVNMNEVQTPSKK